MVVFDDFKEIVGIMALVAGFSLALIVLPDPMQKPTSIYAPAIFSEAQQSARVEKITVPIHTLFATQ